MSDPVPTDAPLEINIHPPFFDEVDNSARLEKLIKGREISYLGERD